MIRNQNPQCRRRRSFNELMMLFLIGLAILFSLQQYLFLNHLKALDRPIGILGNKLNSSVQSMSKDSVNTVAFKSQNEFDNSYLTMYGSHKVQESMEKLPTWLQGYIRWHQEQTQNPSEDTKYLILTCLPKDKFCGGISDRLRPLPFYLLFASMVPRVLCIHYIKPMPLENFLQPPEGGMQWTCPPEVSEMYDPSKEIAEQKTIRMYNADRCGPDGDIVKCVESKIYNMRKDNGKYLSLQLVSNDVGSINKAINLFQRHSYVDKMPSNEKWEFPDIFGSIFRVMFQPVKPLAVRINQTMADLGLKEKEYDSVHVRCRYPVYPVARQQGIKVDKEGGLKFENKTKDQLIEIMANAVKCVHLFSSGLPIYFASDHDEATRYMITNDILVDEGMVVRPVGIDRKEEPLHMGNYEYKVERKANDYFSIFEDLLIIGGSKCVSHGIGSFGAFGAALAGNTCRAVHRKFTGGLVTCPNDRASTHVVPVTAELLFGEKTGNIVLDV